MKKPNGKQIKLIISIISVGIFIFSYFTIYDGYVSKTKDAYNEIEVTKKKIREREEMLIKEEEILASLEEVNKQKQDIIDLYPVYIAKEDNFMFVEKLQKNTKINITSVNVSDNTGFYNTILPAVEDDIYMMYNKNAGEGNKTMTGLVNTISLSFLTTYEGIKGFSEYIRTYPEPTVIDKMSISYDSSTGALAGNLVLKRFSLIGTGKEYVSTYIDGFDIGTDNIFGTVEMPSQNKDVSSEVEGD